MPVSYHAGFTQGIPHAFCATKPASRQEIKIDFQLTIEALRALKYNVAVRIIRQQAMR
jgi:hypothetical protein